MSESMPSPEEITKIGKLVGQINAAIEEELWPGMNPEDEQKSLRELAIVMSHYRVICNRKPGVKQEEAREFFAELSIIWNRPPPSTEWLDDAPSVKHRSSHPERTGPMIKHEDDFYGWTQEQAELLRLNVLSGLDTVHVAQEIEAIGMNEKRAINRQLQRLLAHLLKWRYQPTHRTLSWRRSIRQARDTIADVLEDSHTLDDYPAQRLRIAYRRARRDAAEDTGLPLATFPPDCKWPLDNILREGFLPPEARDDTEI